MFALTKRGQVFVFDGILEEIQTRSKARKSSGEPLSLTGRPMSGLPQPGTFGGAGIKQMDIGLEHAAFVTHRGQVYTVGGNEWGQCGIKPPKQKGPMGALEERQRLEVEDPVLVQFPETAAPIVSVVVGGRHTICTDTTRRTWAFGDDRRIQLGLGDTRTGGTDERNAYGVLHQDALGGMKTKKDIKRAVTYRYYDPHMQYAPTQQVPPAVYNRPEYPPPTYIACGEDFTIALHRDSPDWYSADQETSVLMCCGENGEGQCGRSLQQQQNPWLPVRLPKKSKVLAAASGQSHSLALLSSGEVFAWGSNQQGQIGNGKRALVYRPLRVAMEEGARVKDKPTEVETQPVPEAQTMVQKAAQAVSNAPWAKRPHMRGPPEEPKRKPEHPAVELPGKVVAIACGFRNSCIVCDLPPGVE
jgi:alpha-tubulin suppressor-like RCC1 family protein